MCPKYHGGVGNETSQLQEAPPWAEPKEVSVRAEAVGKGEGTGTPGGSST